ncbi:MAG: NAD-dependent DNA ligase LigA [Kiritimatiellae bacterium]|nr:NAD-dependent DNA ligase LigA [Kiritimatiellia bacterium]
MDAEEQLTRMRDLVDRLNKAADAYYNGRAEQMSDHEWDALFDELKRLEEATSTILPDSPTHKVSADVVAGQKEAHEFAALSLAKTKQVAEVAKWAEMRPVWISWKLDGLTLVVTYDGGRLSKVVTRGDGHTGTNITHLAPGIGGIPARIDCPGHLVVRGEAVISYADFAEFAAESNEDYANPRNLASGSLTLKDVGELKARHLIWKPFTLVDAQGVEGLESWGARMDFLDSLGFKCVERESVAHPDEAALQAAIDRWTLKVSENRCPYPVDGLVVTYDDTAYARTGSVTGHHATRGGLAFKWQDEEAETVLDHVEWSCAVGSISPVAVFRPVALEGTTVKRANLCNLSECERLGVGGPGTKLKVIKANKIIPKVVAVTERVGELAVPDSCPVCGAPTRQALADSGTRKLVCTNGGCAAKALRKFMRFVGKEGMDIDGLAGETIAKFVREGWIKTAADFYRLGDHRADIAALEGFGEKSADNIARAVAAARMRRPEQLLVALSIPMCGVELAKLLLDVYPEVGTLVETAAGAASPGVFAEIDGVGPIRSAAFVAWCKDEANLSLVRDLLKEVTLSVYTPKPKSGKCAGLTFVITGDLESEGRFKTRSALKAYIESEGGKVTGSVTKATSYLINNDLASTSGKNRKARELGIPIISEAEFVERHC